MPHYAVTGYWHHRDLLGAPVIVKDELYLIHSSEGIDRINTKTGKHDELEEYELNKYPLGYDYLFKNSDNELMVLWRTDNYEIQAARLKLHRDGTLVSPVRHSEEPFIIGTEGDDDPFDINCTGVFKVNWLKNGAAKVHPVNFDRGNLTDKVEFPKWNKRSANGNTVFFLADYRLFALDKRHIYLSSTDLGGGDFEKYDLNVPEEAKSHLTLEDHSIALDGTDLYIVYSHMDRPVEVAKGRRRRSTRNWRNSEEDDDEESIIVDKTIPMVIKIDLSTMNIEKLDLKWPDNVSAIKNSSTAKELQNMAKEEPELDSDVSSVSSVTSSDTQSKKDDSDWSMGDEEFWNNRELLDDGREREESDSDDSVEIVEDEKIHLPSLNCHITVDNGIVYLSGLCTLPLDKCEDTHIFMIEKVEEVISLNISSSSSGAPLPKRRRVVLLSDSEDEPVQKLSQASSSQADSPVSVPKCFECRTILSSEDLSCEDCTVLCCEKCKQSKHQHSKPEVAVTQFLELDAVVEQLEQLHMQSLHRDIKMDKIMKDVQKQYENKASLILKAEAEINVMTKGPRSIREDKYMTKLATLIQLNEDADKIVNSMQKLSESVENDM